MIFRFTLKRHTLYVSGLWLMVASCWADGPFAPESYPAYTATQDVRGVLVSVGSDTLNNMMALWADGIRKHHPDLRISIEGKG